MNTGKQQINIELGEKEAEGIYANLVLVAHSPAEFIIDFTRVLPGKSKSKIYSRIIMAPQHTKSFCKALNENIKNFEKEHGEIKQPKPVDNKAFGFEVSKPDSQENK